MRRMWLAVALVLVLVLGAGAKKPYPGKRRGTERTDGVQPTSLRRIPVTNRHHAPQTHWHRGEVPPPQLVVH